MFLKILKYSLLIVSGGFYCLPLAGGECPGHPKGPSEMQEENKEYQRNNDPARFLENEDQRQHGDKTRERNMAQIE